MVSPSLPVILKVIVEARLSEVILTGRVNSSPGTTFKGSAVSLACAMAIVDTKAIAAVIRIAFIFIFLDINV